MGSRDCRNDAIWPDALRLLPLFLAAVAAIAACSPSTDSADGASDSQRIVSLAPNLTELIYTIGAGEKLVAVSAWSDFPAEARALPVVGDAFSVDQEQLRLAMPDLVLVWESGTPAHIVDELRSIGYNVASIRTRSLDDVAAAMLKLGALTGTTRGAAQAAARFRGDLKSLRDRYRGQAPVRVFYQVSARPLYTINREHYVSELIAICGGENIFDDLTDLAPTIDVEAVVDRDPEVMLASTDAGDNAFSEWERWPDMSANKIGNHFLLPADEIGRATTRLAIAGNAMCVALEQARLQRRAGSSQ